MDRLTVLRAENSPLADLSHERERTGNFYGEPKTEAKRERERKKREKKSVRKTLSERE